MSDNKTFKVGFLSTNTLKIIACISMLIDHIGFMLLPNIITLRIIGRLAFPIFAFCIAEGCKYTKNKIQHFITIFITGVVFQIIYFIFEKSMYLNIFITFSISILIIYCLQYFKFNLFSNDTSILRKILSGILFVVSIIVAYILNIFLQIDYGLWGCMLPVFAGLFHSSNNYKQLEILDKKHYNLVIFFFGLLMLNLTSSFSVQIYSLFSIIILFFYSEKKGKLNMKYFFYLFYPIHIFVLYLISFIL